MAAAESETCVAMSEEENDSFIFEDELPDDGKKRKRGIIFLSTIPRGMNVTKMREILSVHGTVGRIFLQPAKPKNGNTNKKKKPAKYFTEGWVEFESKRVAKNVAAALNNNMIGGRKKSKFYDQIWNVKYLPRFKWAHLSERLAYEVAVRRQRLRVEIFQAKKEANYFSHNLDVSEKLQKWKKKNPSAEDTRPTSESPLVLPRQRQTGDKQKLDIANSTSLKKPKRKKTKVKEDNRKEFLVDLFG